jgi:hypothetical protein
VAVVRFVVIVRDVVYTCRKIFAKIYFARILCFRIVRGLPALLVLLPTLIKYIIFVIYLILVC